MCSIYEESLNLTLSSGLPGAFPQVRVRPAALQPRRVVPRLSLTPSGHTSPYPFLSPRPIRGSDHPLISITRQLCACCLFSCRSVCSQGAVDLVGGGLCVRALLTGLLPTTQHAVHAPVCRNELPAHLPTDNHGKRHLCQEEGAWRVSVQQVLEGI